MKTTKREYKKTPRISTLVANTLNGVSPKIQLHKSEFTLTPTLYGKTGRTVLTSPYYDVHEKRKLFYAKSTAEDQANVEMRDFLISKVLEICASRGFKKEEYILSAFINDFLNVLKGAKRDDKTIYEYNLSFNVLIRAFGDVPINRITRDDAQSFCTDGTTKHSQRFSTISPATLHKHIRHFKLLWNYGLSDRSKYITANVWDNIKKEIVPQTFKSSPSVDAFHHAIDYIRWRIPGYKGRRLTRILQVVAITGWRISACRAMNTSWIKKDSHTLQSKASADLRIKYNKEQVAPLSEELIGILDDQLADNRGMGYHGNIVFPSDKGCYLPYETIYDQLKKIIPLLPDDSWKQAFHDLRRFSGRVKETLGVSRKTIQIDYGHTSEAQTHEYLGHYVTPSIDQRKAAEVISKELDRRSTFNCETPKTKAETEDFLEGMLDDFVSDNSSGS